LSTQFQSDSNVCLIDARRGEALMPKNYTRLTQPMVRENGKLRPASWDEALDRAAAGFRAAVERKGPDTFGLFSCSKATNEVNYIAQKFARQVIGTNNVDSCNRT
jgi:formate dehydrogenase major subunit